MQLGELCDIVRGSSPRPQGDARYYGGSIPRLMIADVTRDGMYVTPQIDSLTEEGAMKSRPMKKGDVIIAVSGDPGRACILNVDACIHDGFVGLRNLDETKLYKPYLLSYLSFFKRMTKKGAVGAIFQNLTTDQIKKIKIPDIKIEDQIHIANILSKAEALIAQRKESLRLLDEFLKSTFLEMFGDPSQYSKTDIIKKVGEICQFKGGGTPSKSKPEYFKGDIPWVSPKDMKSLYIVTSQDKITKQAIEQSSTSLIPKGAVLMVVRSGILKSKLPVAINKVDVTINQDMKAFTSKDVLAQYLLYFFITSERNILKMVRATTADNFNFEDIKNLPITVPPLKLQTQFAHIVEKTEALKAHYQTSLQELENLYGSLSQRAFRGELNGREGKKLVAI